MSSAVYTMLSTELTGIPSSVKTILGNNFNNTLCNGVTWLFVIWLILHCCYVKLINFYLKKLGFTQYLRTRLSQSLWLLAFFISFVAYYLITINEYNLSNLTNFRRVIITDYGSVSVHKILAHGIICSFYLHMGYIQGIQLKSLYYFMKFVALAMVCISAYILGLLDISFTLTALMAVSGIFEELSKMFYSVLNKENKLCNVFVSGLYISSLVLFATVYLAIIPVSFLIPLGKKMFAGNPNFLVIILFTSLMCWFNLVVYKSILLNLMFHWLYHTKEKLTEKGDIENDDALTEKIKLDCLGSTFECSLFLPRTDEGYMIAFLRSEIKNREKRMVAKRKPKNRSMLVQTLKCMMVIKRKLNEKKMENENDEKIEETNSLMKESSKMLKFSSENINDNQEDETEEIVIKAFNLEEKEEDEINEDHSKSLDTKQQVPEKCASKQSKPENIANLEKAQHSTNLFKDKKNFIVDSQCETTTVNSEDRVEEVENADKAHKSFPTCGAQCANQEDSTKENKSDNGVGSGNGKDH